MKLYHFICILALLLTACQRELSPLPMEFSAYEHNPVLKRGEPGSWDDLDVGVPQIVCSDSVFYLFY